jgi:hypothetical protein
VSQSNEFCRHNPLCCFSMSIYFCKRIFRYRLCPENLDTPSYTISSLSLKMMVICVFLLWNGDRSINKNVSLGFLQQKNMCSENHDKCASRQTCNFTTHAVKNRQTVASIIVTYFYPYSGGNSGTHQDTVFLNLTRIS